jgi:PAS domain S-box-containing protein
MPTETVRPPEQQPPDKANILLVDDSPVNLLALEAILEDLGHNLVKAASGEEALGLLCERDFAVVLLDVRMPGLGGFETAKLIRSRERSRHTPIILLSAHDDDGPPVEEAYSLGAVDYLVKPLVPVVLRAKVRVFVELFEKAEQVQRQAERLRQAEQRQFEGRLAEENARLRASEARLRLLWEAAAVLLSADDPDAMLRGLFEKVKDRLGVDTYFNFMVNDAGDALRLVSCAGIPETTARSIRRLEFGQAVCGTVAQQRRPLVATFIQQSRDEKVQLVKGFGIRAYACNPLLAGGTLIGTLSFASRTKDQFDEEEIGFLQALTHYVTLAYERVRLIQRLRESEEQFRTLADSIPNLAWMARPDGHIFWYNRRWYDYTGTTPEQMEGWGWQAVHDPKELPKVLERWKVSIATGEPFDMIFPLRGKDGQFRSFLTRVVPLRGPGREVVRWFGTNTDVTERVEMERALQEADRRKDEFLAMLAHELRNPLAPILNGLHVLCLSEGDGQTVEKARGMVERQVKHLSRIVDDLLEVSRITRGTLTIRGERLDLARLVRVTAEDHRDAFERAGLSLEPEVPELPVWVQGDPTRLAQVVGNLLQNALKFTNRGGKVVVRVGTEEARRQAVLTVRDTGIGIEPDMLPRLFQSFAQADRSLDRSKGGLGLGLALVKGLVDLHGGEVHAASEGQGRGAEFTVRLPQQPEPPALAAMPAAPGRASKRLRILVVEDNQDAADSLRILLELFGYEVAVAYTGPAGVQTAEEWHPDVVLCDIGLPGMSGYEVADALRRNPKTAKARMIAVTGYGGEQGRLLFQAG